MSDRETCSAMFRGAAWPGQHKFGGHKQRQAFPMVRLDDMPGEIVSMGKRFSNKHGVSQTQVREMVSQQIMVSSKEESRLS